MLLETIHRPADLRGLDRDELTTLASEIRSFIVQATSEQCATFSSPRVVSW